MKLVEYFTIALKPLTVRGETVTAFNQYDIVDNQLVRNSYNAALDEAQASTRAARFAPKLTFEERAMLIRDKTRRLKN